MTEETKDDAHAAANTEQVKQAAARMKAKATTAADAEAEAARIRTAVDARAAREEKAAAQEKIAAKRYHELDAKVRGHVERIRDQTAKLQDTVRSAGQPELADSLGSFRHEVEARLGVAPEPVE